MSNNQQHLQSIFDVVFLSWPQAKVEGLRKGRASERSERGNILFNSKLVLFEMATCYLKWLLRARLDGNALFYETFVCFYVSEAKPLCFSLCSQMLDDVERCLSKCLSRK